MEIYDFIDNLVVIKLFHIVTLIYILKITNEIEHLFIGLLSLWVSFLMKCLFCFLLIFRLSFIFFSLLILRSFYVRCHYKLCFSRKWSVSFQFYFPILSKVFNSILLLALKTLPHCGFLPFILVMSEYCQFH